MRAHTLRLAVDIRDYSIPAGCCANSDQTGNNYARPGLSTYDPTGGNQVTIVGKEDKRAFTIMVGISMSGEVLPFQVMYAGKTEASLPDINDANSEFKDANAEAKRLRFRFEPSGISGNHWSNLANMKSYVRNVLSVYFNEQRALLDRNNQVCLWTIDCWSVHRSREFRDARGLPLDSHAVCSWGVYRDHSTVRCRHPTDLKTRDEEDCGVSHRQGNCCTPEQQRRPRDDHAHEDCWGPPKPVSRVAGERSPGNQ